MAGSVLPAKDFELLGKSCESEMAGDGTDLLSLGSGLFGGFCALGAPSSPRCLCPFVSLFLAFSSPFSSSLSSVGSEVLSFTVALCLLFSPVSALSLGVASLPFSAFSSVIFFGGLLVSSVWRELLDGVED